MASINKAVPPIRTHEGGIAQRISHISQLRRAVCSCMLWEDQFYEDGVEIAQRIAELVTKCKPAEVAALAIEARSVHNLRHIPLWLCVQLARQHTLKAAVLAECIQRADELSEFLALYWKDGKCPLSAQVKKGLAKAFLKFNEYQLAKYNRDGAVKLRDVLFLCHAKPADDYQAAVWKRLANNLLVTPDTWEVALSTGQNKKVTWMRLLSEKKLGYLALLRNLRNMYNEGVPKSIVYDALMTGDSSKILPFRFLAAAKAVPAWEDIIDEAMQNAMGPMERLPGKSLFVVDVSGSMFYDMISKKSDLTRADAACALAILLRGIAEDVEIWTFSSKCVHVPARHGLALRDAIINSQSHSSTDLKSALSSLGYGGGYDRLIVISDEQVKSNIQMPRARRNYMVNVASNKHGIGYGAWVHLDGFSEAIVKFIATLEREF